MPGGGISAAYGGGSGGSGSGSGAALSQSLTAGTMPTKLLETARGAVAALLGALWAVLAWLLGGFGRRSAAARGGGGAAAS